MTGIDELRGRIDDVRQRLSRPGDEAIIRTLARTFDGFSARQIYNHLPAALVAQVHGLQTTHPADVARVLRLLLLHAVTESMPRLASGAAVPQALVPTAVKTLTLLLRSVESESDERYAITDDRYIKDLHVARLRLIPLGSQVLDPYQGYARKPLLLGGGAMGVPRAATAMLRHGGNSPWHEFHTYDLAMRFFSAKGWEESLRLCIPLLQADPEVKGIFASAWWFDPALGRLTPNMAFPFAVSERMGAQFFPLPRDAQSDELAVYRSPERAALVAAGTYVPRPYLMLLPRDTLLAAA